MYLTIVKLERGTQLPDNWSKLLAMPTINRRITLAERPVGMPKESDFRLEESPILRPGGGEVLVQALYLSVDPYMRGRLTGVTTYARGLDLGEVIVGGVVGRVLVPRLVPVLARPWGPSLALRLGPVLVPSLALG